MTKKRNIGNEIITGLENSLKYMRGQKTRVRVHKVEIPDDIDVKTIRKKLNLTRQEFADCYGFSIRTLQHWEQGNRHPHGPARVLLLLLQREPRTIQNILLKNKKKSRTHKHQDEAA
jgi:putative transcriptional regulator